MLSSLNYARFVFYMAAKQNTRLPEYKGSMLRGALGHAFKRMACLTRKGLCEYCMFMPRCAYAYVFETHEATLESDFGQEFLPHPFIIEPPIDGRIDYYAGDELKFVLLILGRGLEYLPFFIASFEQAAINGLGESRMAFALTGVDQLLSDRCSPIWRSGAHLVGEPMPEKLVFETASIPHAQKDGDSDDSLSSMITIELQTPTRFVKDKKPADAMDFTLLMRSIFRRLDLIGRAHGGGPLNLPFRELLSQAASVQTLESSLTWCDWSRYSERQKKQVLMGGLMGQITFSGGLMPFLPFLHMAHVVHVGKGTVYGMGKVAIL